MSEVINRFSPVAIGVEFSSPLFLLSLDCLFIVWVCRGVPGAFHGVVHFLVQVIDMLQGSHVLTEARKQNVY